MASFDLQKKHQKNKKNICKKCDFVTCKISEWNRHILTLKHLKADKDLHNLQPDLNQEIISNCFSCICGKTYKHRQSLHKHKKECIEQTEPNKNEISNEVVVELIKENKELRQMLLEQNNKMMEIAKEGKIITNNTTNNFSINLFLNEQCKDAINIMEFVNSIRLKVSDLEDTGRLGYVEGISKIFIRGIKELDVYKRPIHCSDLKREVLYIKDQDNWEKDDDKMHLLQAIKVVGNKNIKQISEWQKINPHFKDPASKQNDRYLTMLCNVMSGGSQEETTKNYDKIVRNIVKETAIDK